MAYGGGLWVFGGRDGGVIIVTSGALMWQRPAWRLVDVAGWRRGARTRRRLLGDAMVVFCVEIIAVLAPSSGEERCTATPSSRRRVDGVPRSTPDGTALTRRKMPNFHTGVIGGGDGGGRSATSGASH